MHDVGVLAVSMRHMPEHTEHAPDSARPEYLNARLEAIRRKGRDTRYFGFGDTEYVAEECESAHRVVRYRILLVWSQET